MTETEQFLVGGLARYTRQPLPALGTIAKTASRLPGAVSLPPTEYETVNADDRSWRYYLQSVARLILPNERVAYCHRRMVTGTAGTVDVLWRKGDRGAHRARYHGLMSCGSVWHCPVCASTISRRRATEITAATSQTRYAYAMATYTISHGKNELLESVLSRLQEAYRAMHSGRAYQAFKEGHGLIGTIRAMEVTKGPNGWHPHYHALIFAKTTLDNAAFAASLEGGLETLWERAVARAGGYQVSGVGLKVTEGRTGEYLAKVERQNKHTWGLIDELTGYPAKFGRFTTSKTPLDMLAAAASGDEFGKWAWEEYARTMKGKRHIMASKGLWEALGLNDGLRDDLAAAYEEVTSADVLLAQLTHAQWQEILALGIRAELLRVAKLGDSQVLDMYLQDVGVRGN